MVDVVGALGLIAGGKRDEVAQRLDDVLLAEHLAGGVDRDAELLVDLVAADAGEIVALLVEEQAVEQRAGGVHGGGLAGALATVDLDEGILARGGNVALEGVADHVGRAEQRDDVVVLLGDAEGAEQQDGGLAALAVDGDHEVAALVDLELEPGAAGGDELDVVGLDAVVHLGGEVHAGRTDELGDDDALGAVDDEGAALGHKREIAHEDELLLDLAGVLVDEANLDEQGHLVGDVLGTALGDRVRRLAELVLTEGDLHGARRVLDGRELGEGLSEALGLETLEGLLLDLDEVGKLHRREDLPETLALTGNLLFSSGSICSCHLTFPP